MRPDPAAFADLLTGYCLEMEPGQQVLVRSTTLAAPLLRALQRNGRRQFEATDVTGDTRQHQSGLAQT